MSTSWSCPEGQRVVFEEYHSPQLETVDGIATTRGGRVAWFRDSEGKRPRPRPDEEEIAAALGTALGREVTFVDAPPEVLAERLRGVLPPWQVGGLLEDYAHYSRGEAAVVYPTVAEVTGHQPRDIGQFARDYADAFKGP
jgi:hypothetical protein